MADHTFRGVAEDRRHVLYASLHNIYIHTYIYALCSSPAFETVHIDAVDRQKVKDKGDEGRPETLCASFPMVSGFFFPSEGAER